MWQERIVAYLEERVGAGADPIDIVSQLLRAQIVTVAQVDWKDEKCSVGFQTNPDLPDIPDDIVQHFLVAASGRPARYQYDEDACLLIRWSVDDRWVWYFDLDDAVDMPQALSVASILLQHLPGEPSGAFNVKFNDDDVTIMMQVAGDTIQTTGMRGGTTISSQCGRDGAVLMFEQMMEDLADVNSTKVRPEMLS